MIKIFGKILSTFILVYYSVKKGFVYEDALLNAFYFEKMVEPILSIYEIG